MERKIIKNNEISHKPFLIILLKIFNAIQDELKKLPAFDCRHLLELKGINQSYLHKDIAERLIKKEHEVKLFKETYDEISKINKKKPKARRSDVVMKFSMVSDILLARMKEQLCIKGEAKQNILDNLLKLKDSFMTWGQTYFSASKNWCEQAKSLIKVTDDYTLKYVFSQLATTNVTGKNSRSLSKHQRTVQPNIQETPSNAEENYFKNSQKPRQERHTVNYLQERSERGSTKRYTKNYISTDYDKKVTQQKTVSQKSIKSKENKQTRQRRLKKKTNFFELEGYLKSKEIERQQNDDEHTDSPSQSFELAKEQQETKKSAYFQSQNYIKSRKNLDNITLFVNKNKTKKHISNYLSSTSQIGYSESALRDMIFMEPTQGYRSRKYLTRKYIPDEPIQVSHAAKSEKSLPRRSTIFRAANNSTSNHPAHGEKKPVSKFHKEMTEEIEEIRFEYPASLKKKFTCINEENAAALVEARATLGSGQGKNVGEFYAQLGGLRNDLIKAVDPCCQSRSQFFHQQGILWDQEKRHMQRVLEERNKQLYFREFQMAYYTTNRDEEEAFRAFRNDFVSFTHKLTCKPKRSFKLNQMDLSKEKQAF